MRTMRSLDVDRLPVEYPPKQCLGIYALRLAVLLLVVVGELLLLAAMVLWGAIPAVVLAIGTSGAAPVVGYWLWGCGRTRRRDSSQAYGSFLMRWFARGAGPVGVGATVTLVGIPLLWVLRGGEQMFPDTLVSEALSVLGGSFYLWLLWLLALSAVLLIRPRD